MPEKIAAPGATGDPVKDYAAGLIRDPAAEPVAEVEPDPTLEEVVDIDDTPKADLQDRAIELGLPYSGTKAEIAERIRDAEAEA